LYAKENRVIEKMKIDFLGEFRDMLRESKVLARAFTFGMIPTFWRLCIEVGRWCKFGEDNLQPFGIAGIWIGVAIGYQLHYRWIFAEKRKPNES